MGKGAKICHINQKVPKGIILVKERQNEGAPLVKYKYVNEYKTENMFSQSRMNLA